MIPLLGDRYELVGLGILTVLALVPVTLTFLALMDVIKSLVMHIPRRRKVLYLALAADLVVAVCAIDAWFIEPRMLTVTRIAEESPKIADETGSLKIVHISDIHFETHTPLTRRVLSAVAQEKPDLILVTGDIHQMGDYNGDQFREFMSALSRRAPMYFVTGYDSESAVTDASGGKAVYVGGRSLRLAVNGTPVRITGLDVATGPPFGIEELKEDEYHIVIGHSPDLLKHAQTLGADLYLCGHTHGGQFRLPFWGAITTLSATGKRYEYGRYKVGNMNAFVTRGIGLEPRPAPQIRFLCPPEIVVLTLTGLR